MEDQKENFRVRNNMQTNNTEDIQEYAKWNDSLQDLLWEL